MEIEPEKLKKIFFSGIGGSGMSALAQVMNQPGRRISGSDRKLDQGQSKAFFESLAAQGIGLFPQDGSGVTEDLDAVVVSTAVEPETPDYRKAVSLGLPVFARPELLSALVNAHRGVCFAGTSGKSTSTALAAYVLVELGYSPNVINGAALVNFDDRPTTGNALAGTSDIFCVESCESDGSIVSYRPAVGAVLNIQRDHHEIETLVPMFQNFAGQCSERLILNADCPVASKLSAGASSQVLFFGIHGRECDLRAEQIRLGQFRASFRVDGVRLESPLHGIYNVYNVLASLAACEALGVARADFASLLPAFRGVARRFQKIGEAAGVTVIDDFAHNPSKIAAVLGSFGSWTGLRRRIVLFQPHGYGPTRFMFDELVQAFADQLREADLLLLPEIYFAGGTARKDISSRDLAQALAARGVQALFFERRSDAVPVVAEQAGPGDVVLVLGARDDSLTDFARQLLSAIREKSQA